MKKRDNGLGNTEGAVMVAALFMSALLAGSAFYVIGIGRAVLHHQGLQDAADTAAFAAAVYDARGMNMIAMMNVLAPSLIMVLIGVKILHGVAAIVRNTACAVGHSSCDPATRLEQAAIGIEEREFPRIHEMLRGVYLGSNAVAVGMPWVGSARASRAATESGGTARFGVAVGASLVGSRDGVLDPTDAEATTTQRGALSERVAGAPWIGLPVTDDAWIIPCSKAVAPLLPYLVEVASSYGMPLSEPTQKMMRDAADQSICGEGAAPTWFSTAGMLEERRLMRSLYPGSKRIVDGARNGSDHFAVWSVVGGDNGRDTRAERGVEVASHGKRVVGRAPEIADVQFAKAEFYFEPQSDGAQWGSYAALAPWTMRWRARLRRVRAPSAEVRDAVAQATRADVLAFAAARGAPPGGDAASNAVGQAAASRVVEGLLSASAPTGGEEALDAWIAGQPGVPRVQGLKITH